MSLNGNCHFVFGATTGVAISMNIDKFEGIMPIVTDFPTTVTLFVLGGLVGGIFPDIDNPTSYMGKLSSPISNWIGRLGEVFGRTGSNHRGILHDPTVYIIGMILSVMYCPALIGFFIGCFSHLWLDLFNPAGLPFMLSRRRLKLANLSSGKPPSIIFTWVNVFVVLVAGTAASFI